MLVTSGVGPFGSSSPEHVVRTKSPQETPHDRQRRSDLLVYYASNQAPLANACTPRSWGKITEPTAYGGLLSS